MAEKSSEVGGGQEKVADDELEEECPPYNLVFHGIQKDWMEEVMGDDEDMIENVIKHNLEQFLKKEVPKLFKTKGGSEKALELGLAIRSGKSV